MEQKVANVLLGQFMRLAMNGLLSKRFAVPAANACRLVNLRGFLTEQPPAGIPYDSVR